MQQCDDCEGFLPLGARSCPHCGRSAPEPLASRRRFDTAVLSTTLFTLMACYGGAPEVPCRSRVDRDKDGASVCDDPKPSQSASAYFMRNPDDDCDDADPGRRPGVPDPEGDGIDQNCDRADGIASAASPYPTASTLLSSQAVVAASASASAAVSAWPSASAKPSNGAPVAPR